MEPQRSDDAANFSTNSRKGEWEVCCKYLQVIHEATPVKSLKNFDKYNKEVTS